MCLAVNHWPKGPVQVTTLLRSQNGSYERGLVVGCSLPPKVLPSYCVSMDVFLLVNLKKVVLFTLENRPIDKNIYENL